MDLVYHIFCLGFNSATFSSETQNNRVNVERHNPELVWQPGGLSGTCTSLSCHCTILTISPYGPRWPPEWTLVIVSSFQTAGRGKKGTTSALSQRLSGNLSTHFQLITVTSTLAQIPAAREAGNVVFFGGWWCAQLTISVLKRKGKDDVGVGS